MKKSIPYTIIGGYLGAGKTTLLNALLNGNQGQRLAVLVNDFGDINIDAALIASHGGETISLANGCICCSLVDGFAAALGRLRERADEIDHIIVEASGVADPVKVGQYGAMLRFALDGVIVLADAEQIREKAINKYVGDTVIRQLQGADLLVLNKIDLVTPEELAEVRAWLVRLTPDVRIVEATYGRVPMAVLLGAHGGPQPGGNARDRDPQERVARNEDEPAYESRSITDREAFHEAELRAWLDRLPEGVLRAKGFVHLAEDPERRHLLQLVGKRWTLTPDTPWGDAGPETRLVLIGLPGSIHGVQPHPEADAQGPGRN